ncbi:MAG TPA: hypothetical protein VLK58_28615 [Conexibacter sp.]|nr:hypothetical protein [Conexibacter sp.]
MSYSTTNRARPWRCGLALFVACAGLLMLAAPARALPVAFCPAAGSTISLGPYSGCTNSIQSTLYAISFYNYATPYHCVVGKAGPQADGSSADITTQVCGYGASGNGMLTSGAPLGGVVGYARGMHWEGNTFGGYWGYKEI